MIKENLAVYELLRDMAAGKTGEISKITFFPQKPPFQKTEPQQKFPRSTPEQQGISSRHVAHFISELAGKRETDIHNVMLIRNGHVIGEYCFAPYQREIWHISHSMCKSITGMAVGFMIAEGKLSLEDKIVKIFSQKSLLGGMRQKNITVEHLLTMSSMVDLNEAGIFIGDDWVKEYLNAPVSGAPGEKFDYNSMNSYMLSAIITEITGESMAGYLKPRLFEPLGITNLFWESCPQGITKGGWGLFMTQEDAGKLGQFYLQKGKWNGRQLIPEEWVEQSTRKHIDTPEKAGAYGYGYHMWCLGRDGSFNFNGMLGQNVMVYPDMNLVIVTNAGSDELFQNCDLIHCAQKYFEGEFQPEEQLDPDPVGQLYLEQVGKQAQWGTLSLPTGYCGGWRKGGRRKRDLRNGQEKMIGRLHGREYQLDKKTAGIFPLIMQVLHNNFTDGIEKIGFYSKNGIHSLLLKEGKDVIEIRLGFQSAVQSEIVVHNEPYLISTKARFSTNEEEQVVLLINIAYLEEAARRQIKITFEKPDLIKVEFGETPGKELIEVGLGEVLQAALANPKLGNLVGLDLTEISGLLMAKTIAPVFYGKRK